MRAGEESVNSHPALLGQSGAGVVLAMAVESEGVLAVERVGSRVVFEDLPPASTRSEI